MADETRKIVSEDADTITYSDIAEVKTVGGETLDTPLTVPYQWTEYKTVAALRTAGKFPADDTIRTMQNGTFQRNALSAARSKETAAKLEEVKQSPAYRRKEAIAGLVALGWTEAKATAVIDSQN